MDKKQPNMWAGGLAAGRMERGKRTEHVGCLTHGMRWGQLGQHLSQ